MESDNEWGDFHKFLVDNIWERNSNVDYRRQRLNTQISLYLTAQELKILIGYLELADIPELQEVVSRLKNYLRREEFFSNTIK